MGLRLKILSKMLAASITKPERMDLNHRHILALEKGCCRNHEHDLHFHELLYPLSYSPKSRGKESNLRRRRPMQRMILLFEPQNMIPCQYCVLPLNYLSLNVRLINYPAVLLPCSTALLTTSGALSATNRLLQLRLSLI